MVSTLNENLRRSRDQVERLHYSDLGRKIQKVKLCVQNHPVAFTLLGVITFIALSPFLLFTAIILAPLFFILCSIMAFIAGVLILCFSVLFGFFLNTFIFVSAMSVACCILYCVAHKAVLCIKKLLSYFSSWFSKIPESFKSIMYGLRSQDANKFDSDLVQRFTKGQESDIEEEEQSESDYISALEDLEPE